MTIAKLPLAKEVVELSFHKAPINAELIKSLRGGTFLDDQRDFILVHGTGPCWKRVFDKTKAHIAIGIARHCDIVETGNDSWHLKNRS